MSARRPEAMKAMCSSISLLVGVSGYLRNKKSNKQVGRCPPSSVWRTMVQRRCGQTIQDVYGSRL